MPESRCCGAYPVVIGLLSGALMAVSLAKLMLWRPAPVLASSDCKLHLAECQASWADGGVRVALEPRPVHCLKPLDVEVSLASGESPVRAYLDFQGISAPEAFHRAELNLDHQGAWGTATLPLCASGSLDWQARLHLDYGNHQVVASFPLTTLGG